MANPVFQLLRSVVLNKRPNPAQLLPGQPAVNINSEQPGLFFADDTGTALFKVGPCHVGPAAPNEGTGICKGELWLDTSGATKKLRVWTGSAWLSVTVS